MKKLLCIALCLASTAKIYSITLDPVPAQQDALYKASMEGNAATIDTVINQGGFVNVIHPTSKKRFLQTAAEHGKLDAVKALIKHGAQVNLADTEGNTALHSLVEGMNKAPSEAALAGHKAVADFLIKEKKANTALKNRQGKTAFELAQGVHTKRALGIS